MGRNRVRVGRSSDDTSSDAADSDYDELPCTPSHRGAYRRHRQATTNATGFFNETGESGPQGLSTKLRPRSGRRSVTYQDFDSELEDFLESEEEAEATQPIPVEELPVVLYNTIEKFLSRRVKNKTEHCGETELQVDGMPPRSAGSGASDSVSSVAQISVPTQPATLPAIDAETVISQSIEPGGRMLETTSNTPSNVADTVSLLQLPQREPSPVLSMASQSTVTVNSSVSAQPLSESEVVCASASNVSDIMLAGQSNVDSGTSGRKASRTSWKRSSTNASTAASSSMASTAETPVYEYLVKYHHLSYLHCEWLDEEKVLSLLSENRSLRTRFNNFLKKVDSGIEIPEARLIEAIPERIVDCSDPFRALYPTKAAEVARNDWAMYCLKIVDALVCFTRDHRCYGIPFLHPVDEERDGAPGYYAVVKNPMDLGTVQTKLYLRLYDSPQEFWSDMKVIFANCNEYNAPQTDISTQCRLLEALFDKLYHEWARMSHEKKPEDLSMLGLSDPLKELPYVPSDTPNLTLSQAIQHVSFQTQLKSQDRLVLYCVKWKNRSYTEMSWELESDISDKMKIAQYHRHVRVPENIVATRGPGMWEVDLQKRMLQETLAYCKAAQEHLYGHIAVSVNCLPALSSSTTSHAAKERWSFNSGALRGASSDRLHPPRYPHLVTMGTGNKAGTLIPASVVSGAPGLAISGVHSGANVAGQAAAAAAASLMSSSSHATVAAAQLLRRNAMMISASPFSHPNAAAAAAAASFMGSNAGLLHNALYGIPGLTPSAPEMGASGANLISPHCFLDPTGAPHPVQSPLPQSSTTGGPSFPSDALFTHPQLAAAFAARFGRCIGGVLPTARLSPAQRLISTTTPSPPSPSASCISRSSQQRPPSMLLPGTTDTMVNAGCPPTSTAVDASNVFTAAYMAQAGTTPSFLTSADVSPPHLVPQLTFPSAINGYSQQAQRHLLVSAQQAQAHAQQLQQLQLQQQLLQQRQQQAVIAALAQGKGGQVNNGEGKQLSPPSSAPPQRQLSADGLARDTETLPNLKTSLPPSEKQLLGSRSGSVEESRCDGYAFGQCQDPRSLGSLSWECHLVNMKLMKSLFPQSLHSYLVNDVEASLNRDVLSGSACNVLKLKDIESLCDGCNTEKIVVLPPGGVAEQDPEITSSLCRSDHNPPSTTSPRVNPTSMSSPGRVLLNSSGVLVAKEEKEVIPFELKGPNVPQPVTVVQHTEEGDKKTPDVLTIAVGESVFQTPQLNVEKQTSTSTEGQQPVQETEVQKPEREQQRVTDAQGFLPSEVQKILTLRVGASTITSDSPVTMSEKVKEHTHVSLQKNSDADETRISPSINGGIQSRSTSSTTSGKLEETLSNSFNLSVPGSSEAGANANSESFNSAAQLSLAARPSTNVANNDRRRPATFAAKSIYAEQFARMKMPKPPPPGVTRQYPVSPAYKGGRKLFDYQLEGLNWILDLWSKGNNGILADEMGLGKTVQSVAFLWHLYTKERIRGPFLVLAPLSTLDHWRRTAEDWTDLNVILYYDENGRLGRDALRKAEWYHSMVDMRQRKTSGGITNGVKAEVTNPTIVATHHYKFHLLLTSYEIFASDAEMLVSIPWQFVVVDEAHRLKNRLSKAFELLKQVACRHTLLLTGTPVQNNTGELWPLLNYIEPVRFCDLDAFQEEFGALETNEQVTRFTELLRPHLLRRVKEDVANSIPPLEETIIDVELTILQKAYYKAIFEKNKNFLFKNVKRGQQLPSLMNVEMELRKCCNHPFMIHGVEQREYAMCKTEAEKFKKLTESSGKLVLLNKLLPKLKTEGHKVLIFSQFQQTLSLIQEFITYKGWEFERLDGQVKGTERTAAIARFNDAKMSRFIFLLSTRAGGLGINLTSADTVIIFDSDWNPQNDIQATARAHRIGQEREVKVYRLVTARTYEADMFDRASKKLGLNTAVFHRGAFGAKARNDNKGDGIQGDTEGVSCRAKAPSKEEIEELLKKGAFYLLEGNTNAAREFQENNIEEILSRNSRLVRYQLTGMSSTFAKTSFKSDKASDISFDDPDFWQKVLNDSSSRRLLARLNDGSATANEEAMDEFMSDLQAAVEGIAAEDDPEPVIEALVQLTNLTTFSLAQRRKAEEWLARVNSDLDAMQETTSVAANSHGRGGSPQIDQTTEGSTLLTPDEDVRESSSVGGSGLRRSARVSKMDLTSYTGNEERLYWLLAAEERDRRRAMRRARRSDAAANGSGDTEGSASDVTGRVSSVATSRDGVHGESSERGDAECHPPRRYLDLYDRGAVDYAGRKNREGEILSDSPSADDDDDDNMDDMLLSSSRGANGHKRSHRARTSGVGGAGGRGGGRPSKVIHHNKAPKERDPAVVSMPRGKRKPRLPRANRTSAVLPSSEQVRIIGTPDGSVAQADIHTLISNDVKGTVSDTSTVGAEALVASVPAPIVEDLDPATEKGLPLLQTPASSKRKRSSVSTGARRPRGPKASIPNNEHQEEQLTATNSTSNTNGPQFHESGAFPNAVGVRKRKSERVTSRNVKISRVALPNEKASTSLQEVLTPQPVRVAAISPSSITKIESNIRGFDMPSMTAAVNESASVPPLLELHPLQAPENEEATLDHSPSLSPKLNSPHIVKNDNDSQAITATVASELPMVRRTSEMEYLHRSKLSPAVQQVVTQKWDYDSVQPETPSSAARLPVDHGAFSEIPAPMLDFAKEELLVTSVDKPSNGPGIVSIPSLTPMRVSTVDKPFTIGDDKSPLNCDSPEHGPHTPANDNHAEFVPLTPMAQCGTLPSTVSGAVIVRHFATAEDPIEVDVCRRNSTSSVLPNC